MIKKKEQRPIKEKGDPKEKQKKEKRPRKEHRVPKGKSKGQEKSIRPYDTHVLAQLLIYDGPLDR